MADILGISTGTLSRIERNTSTRIDSRMLCRVCDYFDLSIDAMLYENRAELLCRRHASTPSE